MKTSNAQDLFEALSTRQHLMPHEPISAALARLVEQFNGCAAGVEQAIQCLQIDASMLIGRLRRTELLQLSRRIHRQWLQPSKLSDQPA